MKRDVCECNYRPNRNNLLNIYCKTIPIARKKSLFKGKPAWATRRSPVEEKQQPVDDEGDDGGHLEIENQENQRDESLESIQNFPNVAVDFITFILDDLIPLLRYHGINYTLHIEQNTPDISLGTLTF